MEIVSIRKKLHVSGDLDYFLRGGNSISYKIYCHQIYNLLVDFA